MALLPAVPPSGTVFADRFIIERPAGRGGMGSVFRARDAVTGGTVALKLLHSTGSPEALRRFTREAELLAELRHPGIVSYVAHGVAEGDQPFLAMEWLEGESLDRRLARQPLDVAETLLLLRRIVEALATAHRRGIVHRDLKPSNLFLRSGRVEDVVLLDFGLARRIVPTEMVTGDATLLGTPGYMAPEQASSRLDITPAADVFSLGCVLYECLAGQPPFMAPSLAAALAKILFAEPRPLDSVRKDLSASWLRLVDGMLAKEPERRPRDAMSLQVALSVLEDGGPGGLPPARAREAHPSGFSGVEQQLVSVLLATPSIPMTEAPTVTSARKSPESREVRDLLRVELEGLGARVELLADGSLLATFLPERGAATDQAALAARGTLLLKEHWPDTRAVLTTGRGLLGGRGVVGEAMDRAGELLRWIGQAAPHAASSPVLDELTAGLLGPGFLLEPAREGAFLLRGERLSVDETRPLLGKPTPCVGRERELSMLELAFSACVEEPSARALLVTAPAGTGKSRLRHEFLRRLERRDQEVLVLVGRGDPVGARAANGLLEQALRRLCGIQEAETLETRREKFARRISRHLAPEQEARRVIEFLGELCGLTPASEVSPRLRAARQDPTAMSAQVSRALVSFLRAECARGPVLLVLEDLHWSDALTVRLVDEALRELSECPLMVLALARPEVKASFPGLWSRCLSELSLGALSRKAGSRLVQEVLGEDVSPATVERLVEQAAGNALFLEELIRAVREGRGESPPGTVLAMLQARILRLEPEARQVLLAASFFGRAFWAGGVRALLGEGAVAEGLERWLHLLVERELIEPQTDSRFPGEAEFRFRHALLRDAARELIPGGHEPTGHRLAGAWLERAGEPDPLVLAEHFRLGQEQERAVHFYTVAAEKFLGMDLLRLNQCLEMALALGASGVRRARLRALQALLCMWRGDLPRSLEIGREVLPELKKTGNTTWYLLLSVMLFGFMATRARDEQAELFRLLLESEPEADAVVTYVDMVLYQATLIIGVGAHQEARVLVARALEVGAGRIEQEPALQGMLNWTRSLLAHAVEGRPWTARVLAEQARQPMYDTGVDWKQIMALVLEGMTLGALGDMAGAMERMRESQAVARAASGLMHVQYANLTTAMVLAHSPDPAHREEARALALEWVGPGTFDAGLTLLAHLTLCQVTGDVREAETHGRKTQELLGALFPSWQHWVRAPLSRLLLAEGRVSEARRLAELGVSELEKSERLDLGSVDMHVALAEACFAQGDAGSGDEALRRALHCLDTRASDIPDPALRERFLRQVPENARALELARQRGATRSGGRTTPGSGPPDP